MKYFSIFLPLISALLITAFFASHVYADEFNQSNTAIIVNTVDNTCNTGNNSISGNSVSGNSITTGDCSSGTSINNTVNSNQLNVGCCPASPSPQPTPPPAPSNPPSNGGGGDNNNGGGGGGGSNNGGSGGGSSSSSAPGALAPSGVASNLQMLGAGFGLLSLGLLQAQRSLRLSKKA